MKTFIAQLACGSLLSSIAFSAEGFGSGSLDDNTQFSDDLDFEQFAAALGIDLGFHDDGTIAASQFKHSNGYDLTARMFETDAWKACVEKTGLTPTEYLAAAMTEALNAGDEETAEAINELGEADGDNAEASGVAVEDYVAQLERGTELGDQGIELR